jgi:ABC-2 type transport system ATP-binding protein
VIQVENLTKDYGGVRAVDSISFEVKKGEILGFLGPNGAGKTTTMRVLTCFLPATSGTAKVAGFDVFEQSMDVRKRIGYLPENPPLYPEMTVQSYLDFVARIKNVPADKRRQAVGRALEMCRVEDHRNMLIRKLSRGYRQRVGLAQALVHNPEVIVLDEPTVGLDPKQIIEVRHLIKNLAGEHTIILSTHILPEVSMTCDRVVIINEGRLVAEDTPENLTTQLKGGEIVHLEVKAEADGLKQALGDIDGVRHIETQLIDNVGRLSVRVESEPGRDLRSVLAAKVVQSGYELYELRAVSLSLEDIFLKLTTQEEDQSAGADQAQKEEVKA